MSYAMMSNNEWEDFLQNVAPVKRKYSDKMEAINGLEEKEIASMSMLTNKEEKFSNVVCVQNYDKFSRFLLKNGIDYQENRPIQQVKHIDLENNPDLSTRFKKNKVNIQAIFDAHGMTFQDIDNYLYDFIVESYRQMYKIILVIIGKAKYKQNKDLTLKSYIPKLITTGNFVNYIKSYAHAPISHGGDALLYIWLRKNQNC